MDHARLRGHRRRGPGDQRPVTPWLALLVAGCTPDPQPVSAPAVDLVWSAPSDHGLDVFVREGGRTRHLVARKGDDFIGPVSPEGEAVLVISVASEVASQQLWLHPLDGSPSTALSAPASVVRNPKWAPDGTAVVYESSLHGFRDIYRASRDGTVSRLSTSEEGCFEPTPIADGMRAIASCSGADVDLFEVSRGQSPTRPLLQRPGEDGAASLSPDGTTLAWLAEDQGTLAVMLLDTTTERQRRLWRPQKEEARVVPASGLSWAPDGQRLAVVTLGPNGSRVGVLRLDASTPPVWLPGDLPTWTPTGGLLVTHGDGEGDGLFLSDPVGESLRRVSPTGAWLGRPL